jgi:mRNA interferase MazF
MTTRGSVVTVADRSGQFTGKPRPAVIIQSDLFAALDSVTVCPLTSVAVGAPLIRLKIDPSASLPLAHSSWIEIDKLTTVRKNRIGPAMGRISDADLGRLNAALAVFLSLG